MSKKFRKGDVVLLKSFLKSPGRTKIIRKVGNESEIFRSGEASNFTAPMVVDEVALKNNIIIKVKCFYYSSHLDTFVDKWFDPISIYTTYRTTYRKLPKFKTGDIVCFRSALILPQEREVVRKFELKELSGQIDYTLTKSFGSKYATPPILDVVKVKKTTDQSTVICMWHSRKTGRLIELELASHLLVHTGKIKERSAPPSLRSLS